MHHTICAVFYTFVC